MSAPHTILIVEDNAQIRDTLADLLAAPTRRVVGCGDGRGAFDFLARSTADLLVTDIRLPDISGLDIARHVVAGAPDFPVIVTSGYALPPLDFGRRVHTLQKPFDIDELEALIDRLLGVSPQ
ncbi:response regulator [Derxia gummosa]|uniref:Response regulator n=1 Tax=Derxia gummosa DSM 723 TaxID=1121388 RepID=A0A8B6X591_9BURK|nr:response regulator [Derxia gummosa]